jgi:hypothetical protein
MKRARSTTKKTPKKRALVTRPLDAKGGRFLRAGSPKPAARSRAVTWVDPLTPAERMERNRKAAALLREWMEEDPDYDEQVGAALEAMGEHPVRFREDFE